MERSSQEKRFAAKFSVQRAEFVGDVVFAFLLIKIVDVDGDAANEAWVN